jgi:dynamin GTPase
LQVHTFADNNDALLLLVIPATSCRDVAVSRALKLARDLDPDGTRTVGVISKVDQAASDQRSLAAVQALLSGQGPSVTLEMPWVAMIGQSVAIAAAHSGGFVSADDTLETAWKAEMESLKSILSGVSHKKLGRIALVETLTHQIRKRMKQRLPNILSGLQGRAKVVEAELVTLGEQRVQTSEGTRAMALELCREFEDTFLLHIQTGEGSGWRVVASFEGALPKRMKGLPLDSMFELSSVKKVSINLSSVLRFNLSCFTAHP